MREFPRSAVMERTMLTAEKYIDCCCNPPSEEGEHPISSDVFVCALPSVKFLVAIVLQSCPFTCTLFTIAVRVNEKSPS